MSSILKVDTIQDQNGNLIISKDSGGSGFLSPYASSSAAITYTVTVASKTTAHPYYGVGSSNGYFINGIESPIIEIKGNDTSKPYHYKFDQSDSSNSGHPLLFYNNVGKTTGFSTGVTTNGTPGQAGAYTMIAVDSQTPNILYYQCSSHANMGNHTFATSPVVNTGVFLTLPTADGSSGQVVTTNGSGVLSFANGSVPDDAITLAKMAPGTDGNIISYDASGNPVAVATGSAGQVLTSAGAGAPPTFAAAGVAGISSSANATAITIDSDEKVGILNTTPGSFASSGNDLVVGSTTGSHGITIVTQDNDTGSLQFADGTSGNAAYQGRIRYNHSESAMSFHVNNGSEKMRIESDGAVLVGTTTDGDAGAGDLVVNGGVFLGGSEAKNKLDDYEEGTFTPTFVNGAGFDSISIVSQTGTYTKIGTFVQFNFKVELGSASKNSNRIEMSGLPFTTENVSQGSGGIWNLVSSKIINDTSVNLPVLWIPPNNTKVEMFKTNGSSFTGNDINSTSNTDFYISGSYQVA